MNPTYQIRFGGRLISNYSLSGEWCLLDGVLHLLVVYHLTKKERQAIGVSEVAWVSETDFIEIFGCESAKQDIIKDQLKRFYK